MDIKTTAAMERFMKLHDEVIFVEHDGMAFRLIMADGSEGTGETLEDALDKARFA